MIDYFRVANHHIHASRSETSSENGRDICQTGPEERTIRGKQKQALKHHLDLNQ